LKIIRRQVIARPAQLRDPEAHHRRGITGPASHPQRAKLPGHYLTITRPAPRTDASRIEHLASLQGGYWRAPHHTASRRRHALWTSSKGGGPVTSCWRRSRTASPHGHANADRARVLDEVARSWSSNRASACRGIQGSAHLRVTLTTAHPPIHSARRDTPGRRPPRYLHRYPPLRSGPERFGFDFALLHDAPTG